MAGVKAGRAHLCRVAGTLCDPIWQVTLRSSVMDLSIKSYTYLFLLESGNGHGSDLGLYLSGFGLSVV